MYVFLVDSIIPLSRYINVYVDHLVIHFVQGIGRVIVKSGLEVETIQKIASKESRVDEDGLLSTSSSYVSIYFVGSVDPRLDHIFGQCFLVIDFVHNLWVQFSLVVRNLFLVRDVGISSYKDELVGVFVYGHPSLRKGHKGTLCLIHLIRLLKLEFELYQEVHPYSQVSRSFSPYHLGQEIFHPYTSCLMSYI